MNKTIIAILILFALLLPVSVFSETIVLKSGKTVEGKILGKADNSIKVDIEGISITYYFDEIQSIDGILPNNKETIQNNSSQTTTPETRSNAIDAERIRKILKHLGYPENNWPAIEKELIAFLTKINFPQLKKEAKQAKSDPVKLKDFVSKLGEFFIQEGYLPQESPHPLIKLLINGLTNDDIFQIIDTSPISPAEKKKSKIDLVSCNAISQLGSIILDLLDINVRVALTHKHVFNCIPLENRQILLVDFTNQLFELVDISQYYRLEGKYLVLKEEYRFSLEEMRKIIAQWQRGMQPNSFREALWFYPYIYITNSSAATSSVYDNFSCRYSDKGNPEQAIIESNKAIEIDPDSADFYHNRGLAYVQKAKLDEAILDFNKAIELNPGYADAYYDRGVTYMVGGNLNQAVSDYNKTIEIDPFCARAYHNRGYLYNDKGNFDQAILNFNKEIEIDPNFAEAYDNRGGAYDNKGDHGQAILDYNKAIEINPNNAVFYYNRGNAYSKKGNYDQAIFDYTKTIELEPKAAEAYYNRGLVCYYKKDYDRAWENLHQAKGLGYKIDPDFLEQLKKASGRDK